ncbi:MAG: acyl-CoA dehydratase activase-related protein [[Clostridium] innocuum]
MPAAPGRNHRDVIVLAGRPYHVDPQINHGIQTAEQFGIRRNQ